MQDLITAIHNGTGKYLSEFSCLPRFRTLVFERQMNRFDFEVLFVGQRLEKN